LPESDAPEILLVEDDAEEAELALDALRRSRVCARITHVRDGEAALDYVFSGPGAAARAPAPRLILLDLKLPKVDGFGVLRRLKADAGAMLIPVVVLTSSKMDEDVLRSYRLGANSYIVKPIDFGEFSEAVERLGAYWLALNRGV
jgi:two-component system response regulator